MSLFGNSVLAGSAGQGPSADLGDTIEQSLRFNGSAHLQRTHTSTGNRSKFTISFWVKQSQFGVTNQWASAFDNGSDSGNFTVGHADTGEFQAGLYTRGAFTSPGKYRDPAAWYHIVISVDGTDGHFYINGQEINDSSANWNSQYAWNAACLHRIGRNSFNTNFPCQGYLAEFHNLDGQALDPTDFGRYNEDGVWVPIATDFTAAQYGTNGFHLTFDSSQTNGIGHDSSGNGNHWTASGFNSTSSSVDYDIDYEDTPTNNYATLNPLNNGTGNDPTNANLEFNTTASATGCMTATQAVSSGKWYWEVDVSGLGSFNSNIGIRGIDDAHKRTTTLANLSNDYVYAGNGLKYNNGSGSSYGASYTTNDVIGIALDLDAGEIEFFKNNVSQGVAFTGLSGTFVPAIGDMSSGSVFTGDIDFGQKPFEYSAPAGYSDLSLNNAPEPTIKNGKEHFDCVIWSGDNVSPRTITGLEFEPDFIWTKRRNSTASHLLYDSVRGFGVNKQLHSDNAETEGSANELNTDVAGFVSDNTSDGFVLTAGTSNHNATNGSGNTYVAWCWKAGGTAVSNTDGTITSSVSANTDAGFSIVSYTGNTTNGATVGHGLSQAPDMVIVKNRDATASWFVQHSSIAQPNNLLLNTDGGLNSSSDVFNSTAAGPSVFTVGTSRASNFAEDYIAYCWHSVEGFSEFGSYTGGGSGSAPDYDGAYIYLGFRPSWLLIKRSNAGGDPWILLDSTRDTHNFAFQALQPNNINSEVSSGDQFAIDFLSNGFKCRSANAAINLSSATYVYMAFAENPFGGENQPPATAR
jgi:hypothetical protein